jgi:hypothetical protein
VLLDGKYLQTKNIILVYFGGGWNGKLWSILLSSVTFYGYLVFFKAIWYIL